MPRFLVRDMSPHLRKLLEQDAQQEDQSLSETMRGILCAHYSLDCSEIEGALRTDVWNGSQTVLLKLQPELFKEIKTDSAHTGESMRSLIIAALEGHYAAVT
jgi:hypothetical protein